MSVRDFLTLVVAAIVIALVAALHSPFPEKLSADWASSGGHPSLGCPSPLVNSPRLSQHRSSEWGAWSLQPWRPCAVVKPGETSP